MFTHHSHLGSASHIDRIYTSRTLRNCVINTDISPCTHSDHDIVSAFLALGETPRGKGVWHLNCGILQNKGFSDAVSAFWPAWCGRKKSFASLTEWWDAGKEKIKKLAEIFAKQNKSEISKELSKKEKQLRNAQTKADRTGDARHARLASDLRNNIKRLEETQAEGAKIRSKAAFLEQNEKCSKYFFNLEKKRGQDKLIKAVKDPADRLVSDTADILNETKRFYENLYAAEDTDPNAQEEMFAHIDKTLTSEQNELLATKISNKEILEAITSMANGKSPGLDGLLPEFYKTFSHLLVDDLLEVYGDIFSNEMSPTQRLGLIALLYKKGDRTDFKNWRPISLLNTDYKILAKIFSKRLSKVLATIVDPDQTCAVPNRTILTNGLLLRDIIDLSDERGIPAALVCLDQLKAFDRVSWDFLFKTLIHFDFHPTFIQWIRIMYTDISSSVKVNGFTTEVFNLHRGIRQGCPLSPLLYVLVAEVYALSIRTDNNIKGIRINKSEHKISQYADDTTLTVVGDDSINRVFSPTVTYERASGAKINLDKCEGLWTGINKNRTDKPHGIKWQSDQVKIIGHYFGYKNMEHANWEPRIEKFKRTLSLWKTRNLSLRGKSLVINQLAASGLWYTGSILPLPKWASHSLNESIWDFFWGGKPNFVKQKTCRLPRDQGGHAVVNVDIKVKALHLLWIHNFLHGPEGKWKEFFENNLNKFHNLQLGQDLLNAKLNNAGVRKLPKFYSEIINTWFSLDGRRSAPPQTRGDVLSEPIFFNKNILDTSTSLPLVNHVIAKKGITRITDVSYSVVPGLLPVAAVHKLLGGGVSLRQTNNFMESLHSSLPAEWRRLLNSDETCELSVEHSCFQITDLKTKENIPTAKMTTKKIYDILITVR